MVEVPPVCSRVHLVVVLVVVVVVVVVGFGSSVSCLTVLRVCSVSSTG